MNDYWPVDDHRVALLWSSTKAPRHKAYAVILSQYSDNGLAGLYDTGPGPGGWALDVVAVRGGTPPKNMKAKG